MYKLWFVNPFMEIFPGVHVTVSNLAIDWLKIFQQFFNFFFFAFAFSLCIFFSFVFFLFPFVFSLLLSFVFCLFHCNEPPIARYTYSCLIQWVESECLMNFFLTIQTMMSNIYNHAGRGVTSPCQPIKVVAFHWSITVQRLNCFSRNKFVLAIQWHYDTINTKEIKITKKTNPHKYVHN